MVVSQHENRRQCGRGSTHGGNEMPSSRAPGQWLAAAGLGQAQVARPAKRGGTADRAGRGHMRGVRRGCGDRTLGVNQPETLTRMNIKAFNTTKRLL